MYWPVPVIVPGPAFASPPDTAQVTLAAPPLFNVAVNCSTGEPDEPVVLQPVQLVSIEAVPGATEKVLFDEPVADPPQPASNRKAGTAAAPSIRAGLAMRKLDENPRRAESAGDFC